MLQGRPDRRTTTGDLSINWFVRAILGPMPRRPSKDPNVAGFDLVAEATGQREKNPYAVALGRLGGSKGGKARAAKLSPKKRSAIAKFAARVRWSRRPAPPA